MSGTRRSNSTGSPQEPPPTPREDVRLLPSSPTSSSPSPFRSSPLNPASPTLTANPFASRSSRPASRSSTHLTSKFPSDDASLSPFGSLNGPPGQRGSMVLYRLADDPAAVRESLLVVPSPKFARDSVLSSSGDSVVSMDSDSKYPSGLPTQRGMVPYAYDPAMDELDPVDDEDLLHDPGEKGGFRGDRGSFPWRGIMNVGVLLLLIGGLLSLFVLYPVLSFFRNESRNQAIDGNIRINATGQAPVLFQMPEMIDIATPDDVKTRTGFDGDEYELVFSDEFEVEGRTFYPGDDPFWEAVDLWYGATQDMEWYDPQQITTRDGKLVITMDSTSTTQAGLTPGSTAPFTAAENHDLEYRSGMLQSWNKFCFSSGYIEIAVVLPGPDENTQGYWPGAWTMGNLARPGYPATTDGMWPYTYNDCDVGTFPNQTNPDKLGPPAALFSSMSRAKYNNELSWLSGQRLSACSCPGSDHPGPTETKGRGAPEIDILEAEKDKNAVTGHVMSQSCQFAPFAHDYFYDNSTEDKYHVFDPTRSRANTYRGSAVQQAVSSLTRTAPDIFQGTGQRFATVGFEYWANPDNAQEGYVTWQVDGSPSIHLGATAVGPDQGPDGSGVGQRLIPEEPLSIILNLGMSQNWQTIDLASMIFPAEFLIDYVRVYQKKGQTNIGCDPKDYPTADYIQRHLEAYQDVNMTDWKWEKPRNRLYEGGC